MNPPLTRSERWKTNAWLIGCAVGGSLASVPLAIAGCMWLFVFELPKWLEWRERGRRG